MWSDPIERALLQMRTALESIQRGHQVYFGKLDLMLTEALLVRDQERATGELTKP